MDKIILDGKNFVTESGEHVIFNGINIVWKKSEDDFVVPEGAALYQKLQSNGINLVRLGVFWKMISPEPNTINENYLTKVKEQIELASSHGMYVFLDMHQDLYSEKFGNGAPDWATLDDNLPHITGELWSDTYQLSPGLNRAIDHFWQNTEVFGKGLQEHYLAAWEAVLNQVVDYDNVIGFDLMNEPYPGSSGQNVAKKMIAFISQNMNIPIEEVMNIWLDDKKKQQILSDLKQPKVYQGLLSAISSQVQQFESTILLPFYQKLKKHLEPKGKGRAFFYETSYFNNIGIKTDITFSSDNREVFAAHAYDLVVDTSHFENYDIHRLFNTLEIQREVQNKYQIPFVLGEWGAYGNDLETERISQQHIEKIESYLWSHTYWCYYDHFFDSPTAKVLNRPYPQKIAGTIESYHYDYETGLFTLVYLASTKGTNKLYLPNLSKVDFKMIQKQLHDPQLVQLKPTDEFGFLVWKDQDITKNTLQITL